MHNNFRKRKLDTKFIGGNTAAITAFDRSLIVDFDEVSTSNKPWKFLHSTPIKAHACFNRTFLSSDERCFKKSRSLKQTQEVKDKLNRTYELQDKLNRTYEIKEQLNKTYELEQSQLGSCYVTSISKNLLHGRIKYNSLKSLDDNNVKIQLKGLDYASDGPQRTLMSLKTRAIVTKESFVRLSKFVFPYSPFQAKGKFAPNPPESSQHLSLMKMGNANVKRIPVHKRPLTLEEQQYIKRSIQRRRNGQREVHKNLWRAEKKAIATDTIRSIHESTRPRTPRRATYKKGKNSPSGDKLMNNETRILAKQVHESAGDCHSLMSSLPSRSDILPADGESLRSEVEKNSLTCETFVKCSSCVDSQAKLSKAYAHKGAIAVALEKTKNDFLQSQKKVNELEKDLIEARRNAEEAVNTTKILEVEMEQSEKEKAMCLEDLNVTKKQLKALEQFDTSDSSQLSSICVSGSQKTLDDGLGEDASPDEEDYYGNCHWRKMREELDFARTELERLKETEIKKTELESTLKMCEKRIVDLETNWNYLIKAAEKCRKRRNEKALGLVSDSSNRISFRQWLTQPESRPLFPYTFWKNEELKELNRIQSEGKEVSTQTWRRNGTFTRQPSEKTKIPKRLVSHHNSLPVISDPVTDLSIHQVGNSSLSHFYTVQRNMKLKELELSTLKHEMLKLAKEVNLQKNGEFTPESEVTKLKAENERLNSELNLVKGNYFKEMVMRKKYYNMTEELKGKIRVYCRIKPTESRQRDPTFLDSPDDYTIQLRTQRAKYEFMFDGVFTPQNTQDDVFEEVQNLVQSVLDGYNVCIFAYGQTGSGKTYTLAGNDDQPGIAPRAFKRMFQLIQDNNDYNFRITTSVYELYNNRLIDLLKEDNEEKLKIRMDQHGLVYVQGSACIEVHSEDQLLDLFDEACRRRHTASTRMNIESSRSHLIVTISIESTNKISGTTLKGKLSIVDLAGSERSGKTAVMGEQLKESNSINKSLSALGDVIAALTLEQPHVPYRNNKLTLLMQDSLGGNAKTLMFVTISSSEQNVEESLNSLTYASRVKQITNANGKMTESKEMTRQRSIMRTKEGKRT